MLVRAALPERDGTLPQRLMKHQTEEPASILKDRPDAPAELLAICSKMMAKSPEKRYQTAADVSQALTAWLLARENYPRAASLAAAQQVEIDRLGILHGGDGARQAGALERRLAAARRQMIEQQVRAWEVLDLAVLGVVTVGVLALGAYAFSKIQV